MEIASQDLLDRLDSVLPRVAPSETARRILEVMRRICRAGTATVFRERAGMLRFVAGERIPEATVRAIRSAMRHGRATADASSIWFSEREEDEGWGRSLVFWSGRPHDAERDVVYMEGPGLRPAEQSAERLTRLTALLGELR